MIIEKQWEYKGLNCVIIAQFDGFRCGYVRVSEDHCLYEKDLFSGENEEYTTFDIHGGITFSGKQLHPQMKEGWYIGFDCAHMNDKRDESIITQFANHEEILHLERILEKEREFLHLELKERFPRQDFSFMFDGRTLWTNEMVVKETEELADQILEMKEKHNDQR